MPCWKKIQRYNSEVTQAGFAHDHSQVLTAHQRCQVTSLVEDNTLEHQCDTLSGDSGSPLWLVTENGPELVAVQSSAPDWFNRDKADNTAVTVLQLPKKIEIMILSPASLLGWALQSMYFAGLAGKKMDIQAYMQQLGRQSPCGQSIDGQGRHRREKSRAGSDRSRR